ncbi:MAG: hypothetical protein AAF488_07160 [Planctomycetota bacterium]
MPRRVLILCTGNSCRSQMAEVLWRELGGGEWECHSAGSRPSGFVHPLALEALRRDGLPTEGLRSKKVDEFAGESFDRVVTVCDNAAESCPVFPGATAEHHPFFDPAEAAGDTAEKLRVFEEVRESIRRWIAAELEVETEDEFRAWIDRAIDSRPGGVPSSRAEEYRRLTEAVLDVWDDPWPALPLAVASVFGSRGWEWNGFYRHEVDGEGERLRLGPSAGPPVCALLERRGGVGTSGMCFDAVLLGRPLATSDVASWPGYVSCDGESGLATVSGMVVPVRDRGGRVVAVWDVDVTAELEPEDPWFMEVLLTTLARFRGVGRL